MPSAACDEDEVPDSGAACASCFDGGCCSGWEADAAFSVEADSSRDNAFCDGVSFWDSDLLSCSDAPAVSEDVAVLVVVDVFASVDGAAEAFVDVVSGRFEASSCVLVVSFGTSSFCASSADGAFGVA